MHERVLAKGCATTTTTAKATEAFQSYEATWGDEKAEKEEQREDLSILRLRGESFLVSYS